MGGKNIGKVVQVIGPVLDVRFESGALPNLLNAIEIQSGERKITAEVAQHIGDNVVRCIAMNATDGLRRGLDATDTGGPISVPVGEKCLGRMFNLLGDPIDNLPEVYDADDHWPIHRPAPAYDEQQGTTEVLETGIKVVDLIAPYSKGGKGRLRPREDSFGSRQPPPQPLTAPIVTPSRKYFCREKKRMNMGREDTIAPAIMGENSVPLANLKVFSPT